MPDEDHELEVGITELRRQRAVARLLEGFDPVQENWTIKFGRDLYIDDERIAAFGQSEVQGDDIDEIAIPRTKLASAAPPFARLWLKHEWVTEDLDGGPEYCQECRGWKTKGHTPDCALDAAFKQAGLR